MSSGGYILRPLTGKKKSLYANFLDSRLFGKILVSGRFLLSLLIEDGGGVVWCGMMWCGMM